MLGLPPKDRALFIVGLMLGHEGAEGLRGTPDPEVLEPLDDRYREAYTAGYRAGAYNTDKQWTGTARALAEALIEHWGTGQKLAEDVTLADADKANA